MLNTRKRIALTVTFVAAAMTFSTICSSAEVSHRVNATLLHQESSLHTSVNNRDVYLFRVMPRTGAAFDAVAVDSYPSYAEALPLHNLSKKTIFSVKLIRAPYCDRASGGDGEGPAVRCFTIDHGTWKMPKNAESDPWWK